MDRASKHQQQTRFLVPVWDMAKFQQWMCLAMWAAAGTGNRHLLCLGQEQCAVAHGTQITVMVVMTLVRLVTQIAVMVVMTLVRLVT
jgi:hypothetical protein